MEWIAEKRELEWRAEHRELEWKARIRQLQWKADMQAAQELEESDLLEPAGPVLPPRSRSNSRVREALHDALAASQGSRRSSTSGANSRPQSRPQSSGRSRHERHRSKEPTDPEEAINRFIEHAIPLGDPVGEAAAARIIRMPRPRSANRMSGRGSRSEPALYTKGSHSKRPGSACPSSHRSLADEVAADLEPDAEPSFNRQRPRSAAGGRGAPSYKSVANHSTKWFEIQQARQRDKHALKGGGFGDQRGPSTLGFGDVARAYPEASAIWSSGSR